MCPTCKLSIYQFRFFYQELHPQPPSSAILTSRFMASDSPSISSIASFGTKTFLKQSLGEPLANETRQLRVWNKLYSRCVPKKYEKYVEFLRNCSSELGIFLFFVFPFFRLKCNAQIPRTRSVSWICRLMSHRVSLFPPKKMYTYQHHIPTQKNNIRTGKRAS